MCMIVYSSVCVIVSFVVSRVCGWFAVSMWVLLPLVLVCPSACSSVCSFLFLFGPRVSAVRQPFVCISTGISFSCLLSVIIGHLQIRIGTRLHLHLALICVL